MSYSDRFKSGIQLNCWRCNGIGRQGNNSGYRTNHADLSDNWRDRRGNREEYGGSRTYSNRNGRNSSVGPNNSGNRFDYGFVQSGKYCNKPLNPGHIESITPNYQSPESLDHSDSIKLTEEYMGKSYSFAPKKSINRPNVVKVTTSLVLVNSLSPIHIHKYFMRMRKLRNGKPVSSNVSRDDVFEMIMNFREVKECAELLNDIYWSDFVSILYSKAEFASETFIVLYSYYVRSFSIDSIG